MKTFQLFLELIQFFLIGFPVHRKRQIRLGQDSLFITVRGHRRLKYLFFRPFRLFLKRKRQGPGGDLHDLKGRFIPFYRAYHVPGSIGRTGTVQRLLDDLFKFPVMPVAVPVRLRHSPGTFLRFLQPFKPLFLFLFRNI